MTLVRSLRQRLTSIRYEDGPWPLWRGDLSMRYFLKSRLHRRRTDDVHHFRAASRYLLSRADTNRAPSTIAISAAGDCMWTPTPLPLSPAVKRRFGGPGLEPHLRLVNLETPVDPQQPVPRWTYGTFNSPATLLDDFDWPQGNTVMSLCNNHCLDQGLAGLERTRDQLAQRGLVALGGQRPGTHRQLVDAGGINVGILGFTYGINPWGHQVPVSRYPLGVPQIRLGSTVHAPPWTRIEHDIRCLREAGAELVVACPHWGFEYEYYPDKRQRLDAYRLIAAGADVIIGSSPHVLQPVEAVSINGYDGDCPVQIRREGPPGFGLVAYSLGNFRSHMPTEACRDGGILRVTVWSEEGGVRDFRAEFFSTVSVRESAGWTVRHVPSAHMSLHHRRVLGSNVTAGPMRSRSPIGGRRWT